MLAGSRHRGANEHPLLPEEPKALQQNRGLREGTSGFLLLFQFGKFKYSILNTQYSILNTQYSNN
jgi:hypothetical protein